MEEVNLPHLKYILTKIKYFLAPLFYTCTSVNKSTDNFVLFLSFVNSFVIGLITRQQTSQTAKMLKEP